MKYILFLLLTTVSIINTNAQRLHAGLSAGIDASRMAVNDASGTPLTYIINPSGGIFVEAGISKVLAIQAEANYSSQGMGGIGVSSTLSYKFNYVTIPLLLKLYGTRNLCFFAGGQLGILINAKYIYNESAEDYKDKMKLKDYYAVLGFEYRFDNGVFAGSRYHTGLTDIDTQPDLRIHNRYFSFRIGYSFSLKK